MKGWRLQASRAAVDETTSLFVVPDALSVQSNDADQLNQLLEQIDNIVWKYIDIPPVSRYPLASEESDENDEGTPAAINSAGSKECASQNLSYAVGSIFGRWDIRFATRQFDVSFLPDPFSPLPVCSPAMLVASDGFPAAETPNDYPIRISWDGLVPDDPDSADDIIRRTRGVFD
jgi:hypothetical protein